MIFQDFNLFDHLTAEENVSIALRKVMGCNKAEARNRALTELSAWASPSVPHFTPPSFPAGRSSASPSPAPRERPGAHPGRRATGNLDSRNSHEIRRFCASRTSASTRRSW